MYELIFVIIAVIVAWIPVGSIVARLKSIDLKCIGSGNQWATNVYRALWWYWALFVGCCDMLKGFLPVILVLWYVWWSLFNPLVPIVATMTLVASIWSIYGVWGKGVATLAGIVLALMPGLFLVLLIIWTILLRITSVMSVVNIIIIISLPVMMWYMLGQWWLIVTISRSVLILYTHRSNIIRLWNRRESKIYSIDYK